MLYVGIQNESRDISKDLITNSIVSQVKSFKLYPEIGMCICRVGVGHGDICGSRIEKEYIQKKRKKSGFCFRNTAKIENNLEVIESWV